MHQLSIVSPDVRCAARKLGSTGRREMAGDTGGPMILFESGGTELGGAHLLITKSLILLEERLGDKQSH